MNVLCSKYLELETDFERLEFLEEQCGVVIISYGLAPNPSGYAFEIELEERWDATPQAYKDELDLLCRIARQGYLKGAA